MTTMKSMIVTLALVLLVAAPALGDSDNVTKFTVKISGMNYTPSEIAVEKGIPIQIEFVRDDKPTCGGTILFPELGIEREIAAGESVVVKMTPDKAGEITFTCGMKMMKGKIVVSGS